MLNKIEKQINDFTNTIKEAKGCDEMINYVNSSYISSVKLLMFASSTFSLFARVMMFLVIASAGLLMSSSIGAIAVSSTLFLGTTIFLFVLILIFITSQKKVLIQSIENKKSVMQKS